MKEKLEIKNIEKKENIVGKVVRTLFGGDYKKFRNNLELSLDSNEFIVGTGSFMRSVIGQVSLGNNEYSECQRAIRMEISRIKKEKKKAQIEKELEDKECLKKEIEDKDKVMTDEIRARIMAGAKNKEFREKAYYKRFGLKDPGDPME